MSYAVVHMEKFKRKDLRGLQIHIQREKESKTNPDIDYSRTHLNYDLVNDKSINFEKRIREVIQSNVVSKRKTRKDAVLMCNFIISSDKIFFDGLDDKNKRLFFEKAYEFFSKRYGESNIISAVVHMDEKTPHMHLSLVPVTSDRRLSAKSIFNKKELSSIQDDFPVFMTRSGFVLQRGVKGNDVKHLSEVEFKLKTYEKELDVLIEKKREIEKIMLDYKTKIDYSENERDHLLAIVNDGKDTFFKTGKILSNDDIEKLNRFVLHYCELLSCVEVISKENKKLKDVVDSFRDSNRELSKRSNEYWKKIVDLRDVIDMYKTYIDKADEIKLANGMTVLDYLKQEVLKDEYQDEYDYGYEPD